MYNMFERVNMIKLHKELGESLVLGEVVKFYLNTNTKSAEAIFEVKPGLEGKLEWAKSTSSVTLGRNFASIHGDAVRNKLKRGCDDSRKIPRLVLVKVVTAVVEAIRSAIMEGDFDEIENKGEFDVAVEKQFGELAQEAISVYLTEDYNEETDEDDEDDVEDVINGDVDVIPFLQKSLEKAKTQHEEEKEKEAALSRTVEPNEDEDDFSTIPEDDEDEDNDSEEMGEYLSASEVIATGGKRMKEIAYSDALRNMTQGIINNVSQAMSERLDVEDTMKGELAATVVMAMLASAPIATNLGLYGNLAEAMRAVSNSK